MLQFLAPADRRPALPFAGAEPAPRPPYHRRRFYGNRRRRAGSGLLPAARGLLYGGMIFAPDFREVNRRQRVGEAEIGPGLRKGLYDGEIAEPFGVRRDDKPRRIPGAGFA